MQLCKSYISLLLLPFFLFTPLGIYEEIMGAANVNKLLEKLHIPLNYDQIVIIWFICWILVIITRILKAKLQGTL